MYIQTQKDKKIFVKKFKYMAACIGLCFIHCLIILDMSSAVIVVIDYSCSNCWFPSSTLDHKQVFFYPVWTQRMKTSCDSLFILTRRNGKMSIHTNRLLNKPCTSCTRDCRENSSLFPEDHLCVPAGTTMCHLITRKHSTNTFSL